MKSDNKTVDQYIKTFPENTQSILEQIRNAIIKNAPNAIESISYGMPAYKTFGKPLVYFAGYKNHIGFYALPSGNIAFQKELAKYKTGKGSIQFPLDQEIPYELIREIVTFRVQEVNEDFKTK